MKNLTNLLVLVLFINVATAQDIKESIQNTKQIVEGKKNIKRDSKELAAFKLKMDSFDSAFQLKSAVKSNDLKLSLLKDMAREVQQSKVKVKKARLEIAQSSSEIRSGRKKIREDKKVLSKNRFNLRDDQRDRRDDVRDFKQQKQRAERQAFILKVIKEYNFSYDSINFEMTLANNKLLHEFMEILKADLDATKRELNEDIKERREDARERRND